MKAVLILKKHYEIDFERKKDLVEIKRTLRKIAKEKSISSKLIIVEQ